MTGLCTGDWNNCYRGEYDLQPVLVNSHPAKAAWGLAFRIIKHLEEIGLLGEGDTVVDPLAGTGRFCLAALAQGYPAIAVELEERFIGFMRDSRAYAGGKLGRPLPWTILQGDARNLSTLLMERGLVSVTSPPYGDSVKQNRYDDKNRRVREGVYRGVRPDIWTSPTNIASQGFTNGYGATPGQIGSLPDKPLRAITSPPYGDADGHPSLGSVSKDDWGKDGSDIVARRGLSGEYGATPGQIGNLKDTPGGLRCVTSPPYGDMTIEGTTGGRMGDGSKGNHWTNTVTSVEHGYGATEGQLGQESGPSYLDAMAQVYAEIGKVASVIAIVIKDPTRAKKIRTLGADTVSLLLATGWQLVCWHRAILFEEQETATLFGEAVRKPRGRLSFFKRISYQAGSPVSAFEHVLVAVR